MGLFDRFKKTGNFWLDDFKCEDFADVFEIRNDKDALKRKLKYERNVHKCALICLMLFGVEKVTSVDDMILQLAGDLTDANISPENAKLIMDDITALGDAVGKKDFLSECMK